MDLKFISAASGTQVPVPHLFTPPALKFHPSKRKRCLHYHN